MSSTDSSYGLTIKVRSNILRSVTAVIRATDKWNRAVGYTIKEKIAVHQPHLSRGSKAVVIKRKNSCRW